MGRPRSKSPPKTNMATAPTSSPCTSPRKIDKATEHRKDKGVDTMTKAAATVPTPPRVTRSRKNSGATGDVPNTKDNEDRIDTENDDKKKIAGDKNPTGTEDVLGENNEPQSDGADKGDDKKQSDNNQDQDPKSKTTSAAKRIHH